MIDEAEIDEDESDEEQQQQQEEDEAPAPRRGFLGRTTQQVWVKSGRPTPHG